MEEYKLYVLAWVIHFPAYTWKTMLYMITYKPILSNSYLTQVTQRLINEMWKSNYPVIFLFTGVAAWRLWTIAAMRVVTTVIVIIGTSPKLT